MTTFTPFTSYISFNAGDPEVIKRDGTKIHTGQYTTFGSDWANTQAQYENDMAYLVAQGVKVIRIWPVLSTFYQSGGTWQSSPNSYISNLDNFLSFCASVGMQCYCTLLSTPDGSTNQCVTNAAMYFSSDILQNNTVQTAFLASLSDFITRYKNNTTIVAYDVINELNVVINHIITPPQLCGNTYDNSTYDALTAFLASCTSTIHGIDTLHPITYSWAGPAAMGSDTQKVIGAQSDFYDVHMYTGTNQTVAAKWKNFPLYNKPVVLGECGTLAAFTDPNTGLSCDVDIWNVAPMHSTSCQALWLANTRQHVLFAKGNGVKNMFISYWPTFRWLGIRTDDGSGQYLGHQLTQAGLFVAQNQPDLQQHHWL